jgi:hypothetical protein
MKHPGHTYGGFIPAISEWGMTRVRVIIYERPTTDRIRRIHRVVKAATPRWTFEGGMREAAREALALLRH